MHQPRRSSQSIHSQFTRRRMWTTHLFSVAPPSSNSCFSISPIIGFLTKADQGDIAEETHTKRWVNRNRMWMWQVKRQKGSRFNIKHTYIVCIYWMHHVMANDGFRTGCRRCRHHARKQEPKWMNINRFTMHKWLELYFVLKWFVGSGSGVNVAFEAWTNDHLSPAAISNCV